MRAEYRFLRCHWLFRRASDALLVMLCFGLATVDRLAGQEWSDVSYLLGLNMGQQWQSGRELVNDEEQPIKLVLSAYDRYGKSLQQGTGERHLAPRATQSVETRRAFPPLSGTLNIESSGNHTAAMVIESLDGTKLEIVPAIQETSSDFVLPVLRSENFALQRLFSSKILDEMAALRVVSGNELAGLQTVASVDEDVAGLPALARHSREWRFPIQTSSGSHELWTNIGVFNTGETSASIIVEALDANNNSLGIIDCCTVDRAATYQFFAPNIDAGASVHPAVVRATSDDPVSSHQTFAVRDPRGITATLGMAGEDQPETEFELEGSLNGGTLAASHGLRAKGGSIGRSGVQLRTELSAETFHVPAAVVRANAAALQAIVVPPAPVPLYYCLKLDLGGERTETVQTPPGQTDTRCFKVYMPDRWGGKLTIKTTAGNIKELKFPDGSDYVNGSDTKLDNHGWYTFKIESAQSYTVSNTFIQEGKADTVPWNFFYFPFRDTDPRPQLYDSPGAYTKFDSTFNLGRDSFDWEFLNHRRTRFADTWLGHCWGAASASIILQQPEAARGFTQDELEGLAADFFIPYGGTTLFDGVGFEKPAPGTTDFSSDSNVHKFHNGLREMLRTKKKPVLIDLRQTSGTGDDAEVWNHACYTYSSSMKEDPNAAGDTLLEKPFQIKVTTSFTCNDDFVNPENKTGVSTSNPKDFPNGRREQEATYILMYAALDGEVIPNGEIAGRKQDWLTMTLKHTFKEGDVNVPVFAPKIMIDMTPAAANFKNDNPGRNPSVTVTRLTQLGLKKNNGF
jgi:hypothetical protein